MSASLLAAPVVAEAQRAGKPRRVGVFAPGFASGSDQFPELVKAFREGLADLGWIDGQNVAVETRWAEGARADDFPRIMSQLVELPVDVLVTWGPPAIQAAKQATSTIPIVMAIVHEPVAFGFVQSLAHPGGNITGQAFQDSELGTKRLELLRDVVPRLRRVAFLWDRTGGGEAGVRAVVAAAKNLGMTSHVLEVGHPADLAPAFASARREREQAVFQIASPFLATHRKRLIQLAASYRLPMTCETPLFVAEGCLMAYGPSFTDMSRRAAIYVDKILKGARPADLPVEQPARFELALNVKTAKALGLAIPPSLLARADQVIE